MKNNQKKLKNGKKSYLYIIFLALAFIILLGTGAYAYYQTTITGTISGSVAKWSFKANNQTSTFNFDLGSLYPGKYAEYSLELSAEDSDLPVAFELIFQYDPGTSGFSENPWIFLTSRFKIGQDDNYFVPYSGIAGLKGIIAPDEKMVIPIIFDWPYEEIWSNSNMQDEYGKTLTLPITIVGRQLPISSFEEMLSIFSESDLLGLYDLSNCSNGTYGKYGYPCGVTFSADLSTPPMLGNIDYDDLSASTYAAWLIRVQ